MSRRTLILPIGAGVIGQDDVPLVRIMDSDETPTTITVYGVVDTVQPVTGVTWTVNGVEQTGDVSRSPVLELTNLQPETSYAITLRATNINGESSASARTITTKKITTVTPNAVLDGVSYYNLDVYYTGNIPTKDENDIVINGRDVTVPTGYYAESETVSVSSDYIIPTGTKNITDNGNEDVTQYANVNVNVQPALYTPSNVTPTTSQQTISAPTGYYGLDSVTVDGVTSAIDANIQAGNIKDGVTILGVTGTFDPTPNLDTLNVTPSTSSQTLSPTGGIDGWDEVNVGPVGASIDSNIQAGNIKDGVVILGVTGTYDPQPNMTAINVVPTKQSQVITPTGGVDGFDEVNVYPVTSLIDSNITPENIKKDVAILGVTGSFEGGIQPTGTLNIVNNGTYDITNYANVNVNVAAGDFNELCFTANEANCTVMFSKNGLDLELYYSTDNKTTWTLWDYSTITLANINDKVYFYGNNLNGLNMGGFGVNRFVTSGNIKISGNIMTLITRYGDRETIQSDGRLSNLFESCSITDASGLVLPLTILNTHIYSSMFKNCTGLTSVPALPATTLANYCYESMFQGCTSLTTAPALPATVLAEACYKSIFNGCTSLVNAPVLPATTLYTNSYYEMFSGCTSLTTPPVLPATTLSNSCYKNMFYGCTSLTTAPALPATTLAEFCYNSMFEGCTSLTTIQDIKAEHLSRYAYYRMFKDCTSITKSPVLIIDSVVEYSLSEMFVNCTNLNEITVYTDSWFSQYASNWLNNVAATGTFYKPVTNTDIPSNSPNGIPTGWTVVDIPYMTESNDIITFTIPTGWSVYYTTDGTVPTTSSNLYTQPIDCSQVGDNFTLKYMLTDGNVTINGLCYDYLNIFYIEALENNTVLNLSNWKPQYSWNPVKVQYSTDKSSWTNVGNNMSSYTLSNTGDKVYFRRATAATSTDTGNVWGQGNLNAVTSGTIKVGGLLEYACYWDITGDRPAAAGCENMFQNCTGLVDASKLVLFGSKYTSMFYGCTNLVSAPELPATTVTNNCYENMFRDCTSLTTPPTLPATTVNGYSYYSMFQGCTSLTTTPSLPATTLGSNCYVNMFNGCTSITTPPTLSATTIADTCYASMFRNCTSLTSTPALPATTLQYNCYKNMFNGCTSLTTVQEISATDVVYESLIGMFQGCTNVSRVELPNCTSWSSNWASNWLDNVAANGVVIIPASNTQIPSNSVNGVPTGWVRVPPKSTPNAYDVRMTRNKVWVVLQNEWPNDNASYTLGNARASDGGDFVGSDYIEVYVRNGHLDYDRDWTNFENPYGQFYSNSSHTFANGTGLYLEFEMESGYEIDFDRYFKDCSDWQTKGYSDFEDCNCTENGLNCPPDCGDCSNNWEECGYSTPADCECAENDNCGGDPCQDCIDACEGDPDCEADCDANECGGGDEPDPCADVDCSDCTNWADECCGYESYEDCDCQNNGNCPEEEEPEEEEPEP